MKKTLLIFLVLLSLTNIFSQNSKMRVIVSSAKCVNIDEETKEYLPSIVQQKFEANIGQYMHFLIVDTSNSSEIRKLQQKGEDDFYDEATAIEIGKLANANYAFFPRITRVGKKYILSVGCTNLTTGLQNANTMSSSYESVDDLFDGSGCAVDEVTIKLCEQLEIPLTRRQTSDLTKSNSVSKATNSPQQTPQQNEEQTDSRALFIKEIRQNCKKVYESGSDFRYTFNKTRKGIIIEGLIDNTSTSYGVIIPNEIEGKKVIEVVGNTEINDIAALYYKGNGMNNKEYNAKRSELRKKYNIFRYGLKYIAFSDNITDIDEYAMCECYTLEGVFLPRNITLINEGLFRGCNKLCSVELPIGVQKIKKNAFLGCTNLSAQSKSAIERLGYTQF